MLIFILIGIIFSLSFADPPEWQDKPGDYEFTASMTAVVHINGVQLDDLDDMLAAFDDDENIRGLALHLGMADNDLDGVPDGEGTYTWYNVEKYVGEFRKGFFHGHGTFTYLSGITADGVFRKDKEWDTLRTEENGEVTGKFVKGRYYPLKP